MTPMQQWTVPVKGVLAGWAAPQGLGASGPWGSHLLCSDPSPTLLLGGASAQRWKWWSLSTEAEWTASAGGEEGLLGASGPLTLDNDSTRRPLVQGRGCDQHRVRGFAQTRGWNPD